MGEVSRQAEGLRTGLIVVAAALMTLGAVMGLSTGASLDRSVFEAFSWGSPFGRQAAYVVLAFTLMLICSRIDAGFLRPRSGWWIQPSSMVLALSIALLLAVWAPHIGRTSHGRSRWLELGPVGFQPSEFAKIALVVFLAAMLASGQGDGREKNRRFNGHIAIAGLGVVCVLVGLEDFGTAALLAVVGLLMLIAGGCRLTTLAVWAIPGLGGFAYLLLSHPYRVERLSAFRHVWEHRTDTGYHAVQSLAAIASGGWTGRGLGTGLAQYGYLPEARTDFVFSVICEETGFIGGAVVILLFVTLVYLGLRIMLGVPGSDGGFRRMLALGLTAMIGVQSLMNIAVVTVVAPTTGIALPFVSAGGSGVLCFGIATGLLAGMARQMDVVQPDRAHAPDGVGDAAVPVVGV